MSKANESKVYGQDFSYPYVELGPFTIVSNKRLTHNGYISGERFVLPGGRIVNGDELVNIARRNQFHIRCHGCVL